MEIKCEYCDSLIPDTADKCPNCGAPNLNMHRQSSGVPKTISELQQFCQNHNINLEKLHFHIGEDYKPPKAFGIYEENGVFTVYKNKADGSRAIRYQGTDEAYAVNEIYQKLKAEITEIKAHSQKSGSGRKSDTAKKSRLSPFFKFILTILIFHLIIVFVAFLLSIGSPNKGYYKYNNRNYYYSGSSWYVYSDSDWQKTSVDSDLDDNYQDYADNSYSGDEWNYDSDNNWDDDWDDDDWDYDGWDSGFDSDWDSDW